MPGVPSGRGCNACRKQKKKCDFTTSRCSRCKRLSIPCIGLGQQRYKFIRDEKTALVPLNAKLQQSNRPSDVELVLEANQHKTHPLTTVIFRNLSNAQSHLISAFAAKLHPSVGVEYNLSWTYGDYLLSIPARLGTNNALDKAALAVLAALDRFSPSVSSCDVTARVLRKYNVALAALRECLDDPEEAKTSQTLCAIMLLLICQVCLSSGFIHISELEQEFPRPRHRPVHKPLVRGCSHRSTTWMCGQWRQVRGKPATRTAGHRGTQYLYLTPKSSSTAHIYSQLFSSLFIPRPAFAFTDSEWLTMFDNKQYALTPEGSAVQCLTRMPNLMRRAKAMLQNPHCCPNNLEMLQADATQLRHELEPHLRSLRDRFQAFSEIEVSYTEPISKSIYHNLRSCHYIRTYALGLAIGILVNELRLALVTSSSSPFAISILMESHGFATQIVDLASLARRYRPLGANALAVCLVAAELGSWTAEVRAEARRLREMYDGDLRGGMVGEDDGGDEGSRLICGRNDGLVNWGWLEGRPMFKNGFFESSVGEVDF